MTLDLPFPLEAWLLRGTGAGTLSMGVSVRVMNTGTDDSGRLFRGSWGYRLVTSWFQSRRTQRHSLVIMADRHQTFYYTLVNKVLNTGRTSFSTSQKNVS